MSINVSKEKALLKGILKKNVFYRKLLVNIRSTDV